MNDAPIRFSVTQRALHWLMAAAVISMLFVGIGMVSTVSTSYLTLISIHKPLGVMILLLAIVRMAVRIRQGAPPLSEKLPPLLRFGANASHALLYALMLAMPLIGWGMLSAAGNPIVLLGTIQLPPIAPHDDRLFTILRTSHVWLAYLLFATILLHLAAALFHALVFRDGVFASMAPWPSRPPLASRLHDVREGKAAASAATRPIVRARRS